MVRQEERDELGWNVGDSESDIRTVTKSIK